MATVLYERNDLTGAIESAELAVKFSEMSGAAEPRIGAHYCLAQKRLIDGDTDGAISEIEQSDRAALHPSVPARIRAQHAAWRVAFALQKDDLEAASAWGERLSEYSTDVVPFWQRHVAPRLMIARGVKAEAARQLQLHYDHVIKRGAQGAAIVTRVCQALAADTPDDAMAFLSDALIKAEAEGFIRTFVDEGKLLKPLLLKALSQGVTPEYTAKLLNIIEAEERQRKARAATTTSCATSNGLLSDRELEILRLIAAGLSNGQIADRLIIALGTTKVHVHNIFEKLNAKDRLQAVTKAKELNLI